MKKTSWLVKCCKRTVENLFACLVEKWYHNEHIANNYSSACEYFNNWINNGNMAYLWVYICCGLWNFDQSSQTWHSYEILLTHVRKFHNWSLVSSTTSNVKVILAMSKLYGLIVHYIHTMYKEFFLPYLRFSANFQSTFPKFSFVAGLTCKHFEIGLQRF